MGIKLHEREEVLKEFDGFVAHMRSQIEASKTAVISFSEDREKTITMVQVQMIDGDGTPGLTWFLGKQKTFEDDPTHVPLLEKTG